MKLLKYALFIIIIQSSCVSIRHAGFEIMNSKKLKQANIIVSNEEYSSYIPMLEIIDSSIYTPLDSIIQIISECKNYSPKLRKLITFLIIVDFDKENNAISYRVFPEPSNSIDNLENLTGGFYYKSHSFKVLDSHKEDTALFYRQTNCNMKLYFWNFAPKKFNIYMPLSIIKKVDGKYSLTYENLCGKELYVTGD